MIQLLAIASLIVAACGTGWDPHFCCYPVPDECCPAPNTPAPCPPCLDVAFLVDISSSIGDVRLQTIINPYLQMFANSPLWNIGFGEGKSQASCTVFANNGELLWGWMEPQTADAASLSAAFGLVTTTQFEGLTNTGDAMMVTRELVLHGAGNRPDCPDVCVVITDGHVTREQEKFTSEAPLFRAACDLAIVVAIGTEVNPVEVQQIATSFDTIVMIEDFDDLAGTFTAVLEQVMCPPITQAPPTADPDACCPYDYPYYYQMGGIY